MAKTAKTSKSKKPRERARSEIIPTKPTNPNRRSGAKALPAVIGDEDKQDNAERIAFILQIAEIGRNTPHDPEAMYNSFQQYLRLAAENGQRIGNMQAYAAMGITRRVASNIALGVSHRSDPRYKQLIDYVQMICTAHRESMIADGKLNPITGIFWQRNYDGLSNFERDEVEYHDPLGDKKTAEEIAKMYADIPED